MNAEIQTQATSLATYILNEQRQQLHAGSAGTLSAEWDDEGNPVQLDCTIYDNNAGDLVGLWQLQFEDDAVSGVYLKDQDDSVSPDRAYEMLKPFVTQMANKYNESA